jgi:hypothetical protein
VSLLTFRLPPSLGLGFGPNSHCTVTVTEAVVRPN